MPLIQCIDAENCQRSNCRFIHPDQPQWSKAIESNLTKRRRAEAAAGYGPRDGGYGSRSKGGRDSARGSITSSTSGWGDTGGRASPDRSRRNASPGWGGGNSNSGWGNSTSGGGWGASPSGGGWGNTSNNDGWGSKSGDGGNTAGNAWGESSGNGWGNPEPTSRRTSFSAPKSPAKVPSSPRRERERESAKSPSRHHSSSSSSKEKDRGRERHGDRDRDRDKDRDRGRGRENSSSPSRSHRSQKRSPSPKPSTKSSSLKEPNHSPENSTPKASLAPHDAMEVDLPNPSSTNAASSLSASANKDSTPAPNPAPTTTTQPGATTPTTEMPISIAFPRARQPDRPPPPPLGFGVPSAPRIPTPSTQPTIPPPPPLGAPPAVPSPPVTAPTSKAPSKSPPRSSDATTHSLPARPSGATGSRSPPQTRTIATPMSPQGPAKSSATPATPVTPAPPVAPTGAPAPQPPAIPAAPAPPAPVTPATPSVERPHEWIESLESLIKQKRVLQNCKQQYARAEIQEGILLGRGPNISKRGTGDSAPSLAEMRRRIESTESEMQALLGQFAARMEMFYRPSEVVKSVDVSKDNGETLALARKLSDQVSLLETEMQLLQINTANKEDLKELEDKTKGSSQAILKERGERTKAIEDVKKDVKVLNDDLNRTKVECDRLREELVASGSNLDQMRGEVQTTREEQSAVKEEVKAVKLEGESTKTDVQSVKSKMDQFTKEVSEIKAEMERLKVKLKTPPPSPPAPVPPPGTISSKRARNGVLPHGSNAMEVDEALPPAKRVRTADPLRPSPFIDSTTPIGSPRPVRGGPSTKELLERIDALEDLVETLQGDVLQVGTDVQDQLEEFSGRLGSPDGRVVTATSPTEGRSESAPPGSTTKTDFTRAAGRSSAPPSQTTFPASWNLSTLPTVEELPSDDAIGNLRVDLDAMMGQVVGLWKGEGEWPAHVKMNLCKAMGVESLDEVFKPAPPPPPPIVNGKKPEPEEDWAEMFKSMKEEQAKMREEMRKERAEQEQRMKMMMERMERMEEALDVSAKKRQAVERECEELKSQQAEQRQLLVHLQTVVDDIPKPGNQLLSPENLLQDAVKNGASPVQQELTALRKLAGTLPAILALAGISAEKET